MKSEAIIAIEGLLAVAYVLRREGKRNLKRMR